MAKYDVGYLSYSIVRTQTLPFKAHVSLTLDDAGKAVTLTDDYQVGLGSSGDPLIGKLVHLENDGVCTVEVGPTLVLSGVSGALPNEKDLVVVDGEGCVIAATSAHAGYAGPRRMVLGVDATTYNVVVLM